MFSIAQNVGQKGDTIVNYTDINGHKQGHWTKEYENGTVAYDGHFKDDKPVGVWKRYHDNGKKQAILNYSEDGTCAAQIFYINGKIAADGFYIDQKKDGLWKYYTVKKIVLFEENYKNGELNGRSKKYYLNGNVCEEIEWKDGTRNGIWKKYFSDGTLQLQTLHEMNIRTGPFYIYHSNGRTEIDGKYLNDLRAGTWKHYDRDGKFLYEIVYKNGRAVNRDELEAKEQEEFKKIEMMKGRIPDPQDFNYNPEEYIFKHGGGVKGQ